MCAKAGISTPDWRPLVVALPSAVYSRTGISVRPFVPWPTSILFNAPRTNLSSFGGQRERERECTCYFPDCSRGAHVHTYAVRLSLVEALKAPLCSDRSVLLLEFDERPEIGIQVEGNLKLEEKLSVSIRSNRYVSSWSNLARIKTWLLKMMRIVMINLISVYHCN